MPCLSRGGLPLLIRLLPGQQPEELPRAPVPLQASRLEPHRRVRRCNDPQAMTAAHRGDLCRSTLGLATSAKNNQSAIFGPDTLAELKLKICQEGQRADLFLEPDVEAWSTMASPMSAGRAPTAQTPPGAS